MALLEDEKGVERRRKTQIIKIETTADHVQAQLQLPFLQELRELERTEKSQSSRKQEENSVHRVALLVSSLHRGGTWASYRDLGLTKHTNTITRGQWPDA